MDGLKRADEVDAQEYGVFFAAGGHATMLDFPEARTLQEIAANIYKRGGIVSAVSSSFLFRLDSGIF